MEKNEEAHPRSAVLDDLPTEEDRLDFAPYVETLADLVTSPATRTPLTLGVFGTWGSGKTSLLRMVRREAETMLPGGLVPAWFDAWKYDRQEALWRALLLQVLAALQKHIPEEEKEAHQELDDLTASLYRTVEREEVGQVQIDWGKLGQGAAQGAVQIGLSFLPGAALLKDLVDSLKEDATSSARENLLGAIRRERSKIHVERVQFLDQFQTRFRRLVKEFVVGGKGGGPEGRLAVFVDDLDRCLPEKAVEVLEAIKLFLDVPGCVFVLGLDREVVARGIEIHYRELWRRGDEEAGERRRRFTIEGARYLEKIIQVPFQIPPIEAEVLGDFVGGLVPEWPDPRCPEVFAVGLGGNPRQVKRTVNVFLLLWRLAQARKQAEIEPVRLAKLVVLQHEVPRLYEYLRETPRWLAEIERYVRTRAERGSERMDTGTGDGTSKEQGEEEALPKLPPFLLDFVDQPVVRRVLTLYSPEDAPETSFQVLNSAELRVYFTLTRRTEAPDPTPSRDRGEYIEPELITIPAGPFRMGSTEEQVKAGEADEDETPQHTVVLSEFRMARYPVTNAEYQRFVAARGSESPMGWREGQYPDGRGDEPVTHVSWKDAKTYCLWLSERTGKVYDLPTEAEWEKAARGTDGRVWPWGDDRDPTKANSLEDGPGGTTPVGSYSPAGDSPYGLADMAGNVWEWTRSLLRPYPYEKDDGRESEEGEGQRVLRGGVFFYALWDARSCARFWDNPVRRNWSYGFRLVVRPSSPGSEASDL